MSNFKSNNKFDVFNKEREKEYDNKPKYNQFKSYSSRCCLKDENK